MQRPIIDQHSVKQTAYRRAIKDHGSVFTNYWLVLNKGIRQKSTKEWTCSLLAVPFVQGHWTVNPQTPRNDCMYTRQPAQWHATGDVLIRLPAKTHKNWNACLDALQSPFQWCKHKNDVSTRKIKCAWAVTTRDQFHRPAMQKNA